MDRKEKRLKKFKLMLLVVTYHLKFNSCVATEGKIQESLLDYYCNLPQWIFVGQLRWNDVLYNHQGRSLGLPTFSSLKLLALHWWKLPFF